MIFCLTLFSLLALHVQGNEEEKFEDLATTGPTYPYMAIAGGRTE